MALMLLHSLASIANLTALWRKNYEIFEVLRAGVEPGRPAVVKPEPVVVDSDDEKAPTQPTQANKSVDKTTAAGQASKMTAVKQIASKMPPLPPMAPPPQSNEMMAAQLAALQQKYAALLAQVHGDGPASLPRSDSDSSLFHTPQVARSLFTPETGEKGPSSPPIPPDCSANAGPAQLAKAPAPKAVSQAAPKPKPSPESAAAAPSAKAAALSACAAEPSVEQSVAAPLALRCPPPAPAVAEPNSDAEIAASANPRQPENKDVEMCPSEAGLEEKFDLSAKEITDYYRSFSLTNLPM